VVEEKDRLVLTLENHYLENKYKSLHKTLDVVGQQLGDIGRARIIYMDYDIPTHIIDVESCTETAREEGGKAIKKDVRIYNFTTIATWENIKGNRVLNERTNRFDLILYPQFKLQNRKLSRIYEIQLNLSPALQISLWQGMLFIGQIIFPIVNDLESEGDVIRPGFMVVSQQFRIQNTYGKLSLGNFNSNRYGVDLRLNYRPFNKKYGFGFNAGLTGRSTFHDGTWERGELESFTWFVKANYYLPYYTLRFDLSFGQYVNHDVGPRIDCTRFFANSAVGFYAMYTDKQINGGFHFAIRIPHLHKKKTRSINVLFPHYFDWEYNAGTEFVKGLYYEVRPNENRIEHYANPYFLKQHLIEL
jgi:hypothetical protein